MEKTNIYLWNQEIGHYEIITDEVKLKDINFEHYERYEFQGLLSIGLFLKPKDK